MTGACHTIGGAGALHAPSEDSDRTGKHRVAKGTVYFATPAYATASGGIRQIYRVVDALNAGGVPAAVVHARRGFRCTWFPNDTEVRWSTSLTLSESDLVVLPESWAHRIPHVVPGIGKAVFNQNHFGTFHRMPAGGADVYRHEDMRGAAVVSEESESFLRYAFPGARIERVRCGIDGALYWPAPEKTRTIAYMPRKRPLEAEAVLALLRLRGALDGWEVTALEGLDEARVASALRRSRVFLSFGRQEGFGLPALEAMAAGCVVIGFDGFGGRELFRDHGIAVADGDVRQFVRAVEDVLLGWSQRQVAFEEAAERDSEWARATYSLARQADDAVRVFGSFLDHDAARVPLTMPMSLVQKHHPRWRRFGSLVKSAWEESR